MENKQLATEWLFKKLWDTPKDKLTWNCILKEAKKIVKNVDIIFKKYIIFLIKISINY